VSELIEALTGGEGLFSDFREAWAVEATVEAVGRSARSGAWETVTAA
jgi:hypothetical protein